MIYPPAFTRNIEDADDAVNVEAGASLPVGWVTGLLLDGGSRRRHGTDWQTGNNYVVRPLPGRPKCLVFVGLTPYIVSLPVVPTGKITGKRWYLVKRQWFELMERLIDAEESVSCTYIYNHHLSRAQFFSRGKNRNRHN